MQKHRDYLLVWRSNGLIHASADVASFEEIAGAHLYEIDDDYDFGAIRPEDEVVDLFITGETASPGIKLVAARSATF